MQCMGGAHGASPAPARKRSARSRYESGSASADDTAADAGCGVRTEGGNAADGGAASCTARSTPARARLSRLRAALGPAEAVLALG